MSKRQKIFYFSLIFVLFAMLGLVIKDRMIQADTLRGVATQNAAEFPLTCDSVCPTVNVKCLSEAEMDTKCGDNAGACANMEKCTMYLKDEMCGLHGLSEKQYSGEEFRNSTQCQKAQAPVERDQNGEPVLDDNGQPKIDGGYLYDCCTIRHEYGHICDPRYVDDTHTFEDNGYADYCSEVQAENAENVCEKATTDFYCAEGSPYYNQEMCSEFCRDAATDVIYKLWDSCMCNALSTTSDSQVASGYTGFVAANQDNCCNCTNTCLKTDIEKIRSLMPSSCLSIDSALDSKNDPYFRFFTNHDLEVLQSDTCKEISSGGSGHGCDYYGGSKDFTYDEKCTQIFPAQCGPTDYKPDSTWLKQQTDKKCQELTWGGVTSVLSYTNQTCSPCSAEQAAADPCHNCGPNMCSDYSWGGAKYSCVNTKDTTENDSEEGTEGVSEDIGDSSTDPPATTPSLPTETTNTGTSPSATPTPTPAPIAPSVANPMGTLPVNIPSTTGYVLWSDGKPTTPINQLAEPQPTVMTPLTTPTIVAPAIPSLADRLAYLFKPSANPLPAVIEPAKALSSGLVYWDNSKPYLVNSTQLIASIQNSTPVVVPPVGQPSLLQRLAYVFVPSKYPITVTSQQMMMSVAPR